MRTTATFKPCSRKDGERCLMHRFDGKCEALSDTTDCTFFKDKTKMSDEEIRIYDEQLYLKNYSPAKPARTAELIEKGKRIREGSRA